MQHKLVNNFDWQSTEGQSLLKMKWDLYSEYLKQPKEGSDKVDEAFLNQAILRAYRMGRSEIYQKESEIYDEVCNQIMYELEIIKNRNGT